MTDFEVTWHTLFLNIIPFACAQLFLVVLVYFTLVRERFSAEYPYYATFLISFILYLVSPLVGIMPLDTFPYVIHYTACTLLYSAGIPSLTVALFLQSKLPVPRLYVAVMSLLGLSWSVYYLLTADYHNLKVNVFTDSGISPVIPQWMSFQYVYNLQSVLIFVALVLPGFYILKNSEVKTTRVYVYGMLSLALFAIIGGTFEQWGVYYTGSALCAFAWAWALFTDIRKLNEKAKAHHAHHKGLATAQFAIKSEGLSVEELYPDSLDETYPFREREELLEVIRTSSLGLVNEKVTHMVNALLEFSKNDDKVVKARLRELLFLMTDTCIYHGGPAKILVVALDKKGNAIDEIENKQQMLDFLVLECESLIEQVKPTSRQTATDVLVERVKSYVLAHYHKETLNIDTIAQAIGVSRSHVMKSFKSKYDMTLNQYITEVRLTKAKSFLLEKSVTETAFEVGFKSANYFSTFFSKHVGVTPKQFQHNAKG